MGGPRNASPEVRAKAVLDLLEMAVRGQVPDDEDPTSDYAFMDGALSMLQADLPTLMAQASAGWSDQFGRALNSAETSLRSFAISMRFSASAVTFWRLPNPRF